MEQKTFQLYFTVTLNSTKRLTTSLSRKYLPFLSMAFSTCRRPLLYRKFCTGGKEMPHLIMLFHKLASVISIIRYKAFIRAIHQGR